MKSHFKLLIGIIFLACSCSSNAKKEVYEKSTYQRKITNVDIHGNELSMAFDKPLAKDSYELRVVFEKPYGLEIVETHFVHLSGQVDQLILPLKRSYFFDSSSSRPEKSIQNIQFCDVLINPVGADYYLFHAQDSTYHVCHWMEFRKTKDTLIELPFLPRPLIKYTKQMIGVNE